MFKKYLFAASFAMAASGVAIGAQAPAAQAQDAAKPATTITGCVYNEKDVPGRAPNVAEKAGVMEDGNVSHPDSGTPRRQTKPSAAITSTSPSSR